MYSYATTTESPKLAVVPSGRSLAIAKTLLFMEQNFVEPVTLSQLAAIANLTLFRFAAVFRREVGMPPYRYISHLRVQQAKALLQQGVPAAVVAAETGFFDQSHMYRHFKRVCGVTPSQFKASAMMVPLPLPLPTLSGAPAEAH